MPQDKHGRNLHNSGLHVGKTTEKYPHNVQPGEKYSATFKFQRVTPEMIAASAHSGKNPSSAKNRDAASRPKSNYAASKTRSASKDIHAPNISRVSSGKNLERIDNKTSKNSKNIKGTAMVASGTTAVSGTEILKRRLTASRMPHIHTVDSHIIRRFPFKILALAIFGTVLFMLMIYNNVQINEKAVEVAELQTQISAFDGVIGNAALLVERKNDLRLIEQRALELGMVKADQLEKKYVTIPSEDQITIVDDETGDVKTFHMTDILESIRQNISDFFAVFK